MSNTISNSTNLSSNLIENIKPMKKLSDSEFLRKTLKKWLVITQIHHKHTVWE